MTFVQIELRLLEGVHVGAGRAGMVSRAQGFVPGHVIAYALAAVLGRRLGGQPADFDRAVAAVRDTVRCGPLFIGDGASQTCLLPRRDRERIERDYLIGVNHTALDGSVRRHVDGGLFEVEAIAPCRQHGGRAPTCLGGGLWMAADQIERVAVRDLLATCVLGGERNAGLGRIELTEWTVGAGTYAGLGQIAGDTLRIGAGEVVPGPALGGVGATGWQPWLGRLHDNRRGAGRRFSAPVLIRLDGLAGADTAFELETAESGFGCWKPSG
jgi:hypothetical protein